MKAKTIQFKQFGGPEVLELMEVPIPSLKANELLLKIYAAGVNPIDAKIREGSSFVAKSLTLPAGLGFDVCGEVVECGVEITAFKKGDAVFGSVGRYDHPSAYAEYCIAKQNDLIQKPAGLDLVQAAALPTVGLAAWQALHTVGQVKKNERVLIHAAAGGVGHLAVQIAKMAGAYVIGTASGEQPAFLRQLGVDDIINYTQQPFEEKLKDIDLVIDLVGGDTGVRSLSVLKPTGRIVTVPTNTRDLILAEAKKKNIKAMGMLAEIVVSELQLLADMIASKQIQLQIAATFPLKDAVKAHQILEQKHTQGKIVLVNI